MQQQVFKDNDNAFLTFMETIERKSREQQRLQRQKVVILRRNKQQRQERAYIIPPQLKQSVINYRQDKPFCQASNLISFEQLAHRVHSGQSKANLASLSLRAPKMPHLRHTHRWDEINLISLPNGCSGSKLKTLSVGDDRLTKVRKPSKRLSVRLKESKTMVQVERIPTLKHTISQDIEWP